MADSSYVVQVKAGDSWVDIATVGVPARSRRRTIIRAAIDAVDWKPGEEDNGTGALFRVLDEDSAREIPVRVEQPEPQLRIG